MSDDMKKTVAEREAELRSKPVEYYSNGSVKGLNRVTYSKLLRECERQHAEIERLQAIVDKLPMTEDGVPAVPGMIIWPLHFLDPLDGEEQEEGMLLEFMGTDLLTGDTARHGDELIIGKCYSTRKAAAEAAGG